MSHQDDEPKIIEQNKQQNLTKNRGKMSWGFKKILTWHTTKYGDPYSEFVLCI